MAKTAIAIGAVSAALAAGAGAVSQDQAARKSRGMTVKANQLAQNAALKQEQTTEDTVMRANKKLPDLAALMADAQNTKGPSTMLTGPRGLPTTNLLGM